MKNYQWKSDLADFLQEFLAEKRISGFKYEGHGRCLSHFDKYYYSRGYTGVHLTKSMMDNFIYGFEFEKASTRYRKEITLNGFAEYLVKRGYTSYVPPVKSGAVKKRRFIPYIFSKEELMRFFTAIVQCPPSPYSNRKMVDPVLFRLLYGTGLRLSEALNLLCREVNLESGTLTIRHAKNNKDRLVPVSGSLVGRFKELFSTLHMFDGDTACFFASSRGGKLDGSTAYLRFRDYLLLSGIPHSKTGPRIHDLRHTFAVHSLKRRVLAGDELTNIIPYLAAYMGHSDFRGTQYYLRLTADLYPDIVDKTEAEFGYVIPGGGIHGQGE